MVGFGSDPCWAEAGTQQGQRQAQQDLDHISRPEEMSACGTWPGQRWEVEGAILSGHWVVLHLTEGFSARGTTWFANGKARAHGCLQGSGESCRETNQRWLRKVQSQTACGFMGWSCLLMVPFSSAFTSH